MREITALFALITLGTIGYLITESLSSDAQAIIVTLGIVALSFVSALAMVIRQPRIEQLTIVEHKTLVVNGDTRMIRGNYEQSITLERTGNATHQLD